MRLGKLPKKQFAERMCEMRKLYIICFATLTTLFVTCYCIGYYAIIKNNREVLPAKDYYEAREAAVSDEAVVKRDTELIIENYNINNHMSTSYTVVPSIEILGLDREAYADVLKKYMENPSDDDVDNGLCAVNLVEFSASRIIVRKSYDAPTYSATKNFILYALDGRVVVYYEDFMTIYDYTDIKVTDLPIDLQRKVYVGMQVKDLEELYEFLEDHTS